MREIDACSEWQRLPSLFYVEPPPYDLSRTPAIGCNVVLTGDAHVSNFGKYGTAQRELVHPPPI
jgi:hypothetical protein